jgi:hypothetical protein
MPGETATASAFTPEIILPALAQLAFLTEPVSLDSKTGIFDDLNVNPCQSHS